MSPNQAIPNMPLEVDTPNVPDLPFSYEQRNEIFSETSSRMYRELCGPEGVVLQQNNILQQVIQQVHHDSNLHGTINEQQENISQIVAEVNRLREELARLKLALRQGFIFLLMKHVPNIRLHWKDYSPLQVQKLEQARKYMRLCSDYRVRRQDVVSLTSTYPSKESQSCMEAP